MTVSGNVQVQWDSVLNVPTQGELDGQGNTMAAGHTQLLTDADGLLPQHTTNTYGVLFADRRMISHRLVVIDGVLPSASDRRRTMPFATVEALELHRSDITAVRETALIEDGSKGYGALQERYIFANATGEDVVLKVQLEQGCDFAALLDLKAGRTDRAPGSTMEVGPGSVSWVQRADGGVRRKVIHVGTAPDDVADVDGLTTMYYEIKVPAYGHAQLDAADLLFMDERQPQPTYTVMPAAATDAGLRYRQWQQDAATVSSGSEALNRLFADSSQALYQLRLPVLERRSPGDLEVEQVGHTYSAGIPWFPRLFARDIREMQRAMAAFDPQLALTAFSVFARTRARATDRVKGIFAGKVLHEALATYAETLDQADMDLLFEAADATPSAIAMLNDARKLGADPDAISRHFVDAEAMMFGLQNFAMGEHNGQQYLTWFGGQTVIQIWKDKPTSTVRFDCAVDESGAPIELPLHPLLTAEAQARLYEAYIAMAELSAWQAGRLETGRQRESAAEYHQKAIDFADKAHTLKTRFNEDFLVVNPATRQPIPYIAQAIDGAGELVDGLADDMYLCMQVGLLTQTNAEHAALWLDHGFLSGSGVRTMHPDNAGYDPNDEQRGGVWDKQTSNVIDGLRRYGFHSKADEILAQKLDAAAQANGHSYECVSGNTRQPGQPVELLPRFCDPQGWSATSPYLDVQSLLGLRVNADRRTVFVDPAVPDWLGVLEVTNLRIGETLATVRAEGRSIEVVAADGSELVGWNVEHRPRSLDLEPFRYGVVDGRTLTDADVATQPGPLHFVSPELAVPSPAHVA